MTETQRARQVWKQNVVPVVFRQSGKQPLLIRIPFRSDNYDWLRDEHRVKPKWNPQYKCWQAPKAWFQKVSTALLWRFRKLYIIQPFRTQEKCAPACWNAKGFDCNCSWRGDYHGSENSDRDWYVVSDTFCVSWSERRYACRLLTFRDPTQTIERPLESA